ncbi:MAG: radical SAM protein [Erythrobacter sp.]|nr:radical SAM protein [Erythrobacter sp.]
MAQQASGRSKSRKAPAGPSPFAVTAAPLPMAKFSDPLLTAKGEERASVALRQLETLWFATGTLCNLACANCYIESSPTNDALVWLTLAEVERFLDEIAGQGVREIGFTGGEPFMNPEIIAMVETALERGHRVLVLTNAMAPMRRHEAALLRLRQAHGDWLTLRVSIDHHTQGAHEAERGANSWAPMLGGLRWLSDNGFSLATAGRHLAGESDGAARTAYAALFAAQQIAIDCADPARLVLFPEMDAAADIAEITTACWDILGKSPDQVMCASSRMVVHRKGEPAARVVACTLLPYDPRFDLGASLAEASREVSLNHPHCARFCVLGGASCSA